MMCVVDWVLLLKYLKVFLSWPPLITITILFVILKFKPEISVYIRYLKFRMGDIEVSSQPPQPQVAVEITDSFPKPIHEPTPETEPKLTEPTPEVMPESLRNDPYAEEEIKKAKENPIAYVARFKDICIQLRYEKLYTRMYGTQLQLLRELESSVNGKHLVELAHYFEEHKRLAAPHPFYSYQTQYMQFLIDSNLIINDTPSSNNSEINVMNAFNPRYKITITGLEFYAYVQQNYPIGSFFKPY